MDLKTAAKEFQASATAGPLADSLTASQSDRSALCREAQNTLRAAIASTDSAFVTGAIINRILKASVGKDARGAWAYPAQDSLRAGLLFAGAGLDRALKRLAEDAIPALVAVDGGVNSKFQSFAQDAITDGESVDPKRLVTLLLGTGDSPRDTLVKSWVYRLGASSAQSAERVSELASAMGVTEAALRKRIAATVGKTSKLEKAFSARNEIAHELDVTDPEAETRKKLERIRRARNVKDVRGHATEMLEVTQLLINDVANRLAGHGMV